MADNTGKQKTQAEQAAQNDLLAALGRIYSYVKSRETTKTFATFSFDDYIQMTKDQIKLEGSQEKKNTRPTKLERLKSIEDEIDGVIKKAKDLKEDNDKKS